jgi:hypothetical protein
MSDESEDPNVLAAFLAEDLITQLKCIGLFENHDYKEIMAACLYMACRAIHSQTKRDATACLRMTAHIVDAMREHELHTGDLQAMLDAEQVAS